MKKIWKIAVLAAMFVGFFASSPRIQAESNKQDNEVIVVYKNTSGKETVIEQADTVEHVLGTFRSRCHCGRQNSART